MDGVIWNKLKKCDIFNSKPIITSFLSIMFVACFLPRVVTDVSAQDEPLTVRTYRVEYADVHRLEPILHPLVSAGGSLSVDRRTNSVIVRDTGSCLRAIAETIARLDTEMPSQTFHLNHADANEIAGKIKRVLGAANKIVEPDLRTHTVYVMASLSNLERLKPLVSGWDKPLRQVRIEADILEVSSGKLKELGVEWELRLGYSDNKHEAVFNIDAQRDSSDRASTGSALLGTRTVTIPPVYDAAGNLITPGQVIPGSDFSAIIEALVEDRSTKTLSRPRILVVDGQPARFEVSTLEPYANSRYSESGAAASLDIQFLDVGIILETTPHINDEDYIIMDVQPEISTLERDEFFDTTIIPDEGGVITNTIRVPVKFQRRASTVVIVRDKQTIAIGGLRTREDTESIRKIPVLGDIPILGIPFRNLNKSRDKRELVIFITPHIVSPSVSSAEASRLGRRELSKEGE